MPPLLSSFLENVLPAERLAIEDQTNSILGKLTEEEKRKEAERIFKNMDPKLVEFLKKRKKEAQEKRAAEKTERQEKSANMVGNISERNPACNSASEPMDTSHCEKFKCSHDDDFLNPEKQTVLIEGEAVEIPLYIDPSHNNMGNLEPEKLQWMSDIPKTKPAHEKDNGEVQVRFDFDGKIVPRGTEVHIDKGLHHHGEEPAEAGYTLDELFILSRSMVLRQRQIALETLVHITQRARHALYTKHVQQPMFQLLLDSGIVQLFRHALDTSEYELALQGLAALLLSPTEIFIQDECYPEMSIYTLQPNHDITKDMDHDTVLATDVVRLLVDSQLPQRFWYLLSKHELTKTLINNVLNIIQHLVQHSLHVAMVFMKHRILLDKLVDLYLPGDLTHLLTCDSDTQHPSHIVVKILRMLACHRKTIAEDLIKFYSLENLIKTFLSLRRKDFKGDEVMRCQIEVSRLWDVMLKWRLCSGVYSAVYPLLVRELAGGGQNSVKLTASLVCALTTGLDVFPWEQVGSVYHPILNNILTWAKKPLSGSDLPPKDDIALIAAILRFLNRFVKIHHSKHFDVHLVEQVTDLVDKVIRPLVVGTMLSGALDTLVYCKAFLPKNLLKVESMPTLELHQYHKPTRSSTDTLDLTSLSEQGEKLLLFYACTEMLRATCSFLNCAFGVSKQLSEVVTGFVEKCTAGLMRGVRRHRRYDKQGYLDCDIPDLVLHSLNLVQYEYLLLAHKVCTKNNNCVRREELLECGLEVVSGLRSGYQYQQFNLISLVIFPLACPSLTPLFIRNFESAVTRNKLMKSQKYWTQAVDATERSLYLTKVAEESNVSPVWVFLSDEVLAPLPEPTMVEYLDFLEQLITYKGLLSGVPVCVYLIYVMKIFMLPSQSFLDSNTSQVLRKLLLHFSSLPHIDFMESKLSGYLSFGDFFNSFCGVYEAEGFCDPVFAGYVLLPTRCDYALTYRRLIWVERVETLRLLRKSSLDLSTTLIAIETDADMMTIYVTALKNGISGIPKMIAMHHLVRFLVDDRVKKEDILLALVIKYLSLCPIQVKDEILRFERVNSFNEVEFYEKIPDGRRDVMQLN